MRWGSAILATWLLALPAAADEKAPRLGEFIPAAPPVSAPVIGFADLDGNGHRLGEFTGKPVLINLWATWCGPCIEEMPSLAKLQDRLGDRLTVLAISEDHAGAKTVVPFLAEHQLKSLRAYLDPKSEIGQALGVRGLPTSVLVDRDGKVAGRVEGRADWNSPKLLAALEPFLADNAVVKTSARPGSP